MLRQVVLDTETTGIDFKSGHRVIEIGCIEIINRKFTGSEYQTYLNPDRDIDEGAAKVHGLTLDFLKDKPRFVDIAEEFLEFIQGSELLIHNAEFDLGFINNELMLLGIEPLKNKIIDTVSFARKKLNTRIANLDYLCRRFQIDLSERDLHGALLDSQLLAEVYLELMGGKQISLNLNITKENKNLPAKNNIKKNYLFSRVVLNDKDTLLHKSLVKEIKDSLWKKFDY